MNYRSESFMQDVKIIFAQNLISLRKQMKLTQIELAEKINYSDKAVSKWERGESIPDVTVLMSIAELFGVTLDFLVTERTEPDVIAEQTSYAKAVKKRNRLLIAAITFIAIAAVETVIFAIVQSLFGNLLANLVYCYVYPLPAAAIVAIVFASMWAPKSCQFWAVTLLIASLTLDAFLIPLRLTGRAFPWIFAILLPAELVTMLSYKIIKLKK